MLKILSTREWAGEGQWGKKGDIWNLQQKRLKKKKKMLSPYPLNLKFNEIDVNTIRFHGNSEASNLDWERILGKETRYRK